MGVLLVALQVPLTMMCGVVSERASRRDAVVQRGQRQLGRRRRSIGGPVLSVPYRYTWTDAAGTAAQAARPSLAITSCPRRSRSTARSSRASASASLFNVIVYTRAAEDARAASPTPALHRRPAGARRRSCGSRRPSTSASAIRAASRAPIDADLERRSRSASCPARHARPVRRRACRRRRRRPRPPSARSRCASSSISSCQRHARTPRPAGRQRDDGAADVDVAASELRRHARRTRRASTRTASRRPGACRTSDAAFRRAGTTAIRSSRAADWRAGGGRGVRRRADSAGRHLRADRSRRQIRRALHRPDLRHRVPVGDHRRRAWCTRSSTCSSGSRCASSICCCCRWRSTSGFDAAYARRGGATIALARLVLELGARRPASGRR